MLARRATLCDVLGVCAARIVHVCRQQDFAWLGAQSFAAAVVRCNACPDHTPLAVQDTHVIQVPFIDDSSGFFAVYDGHGGKEAADLASAELHKFLEQELGKQPSVKASFVSAYEKMDDRLKFDALYMGATAVTCLIRQEGGAYVLGLCVGNRLQDAGRGAPGVECTLMGAANAAKCSWKVEARLRG